MVLWVGCYSHLLPRKGALFVAPMPSVLYLERVKQGKTSTSPTSHGVDGGTAALGGFLYQMLGCAAVCAEASHDEPPADSELEVLVLLARGKAVYQEVHGQDLVLKPFIEGTGQGTVLVQFKYSRKDRANPVLPGELEVIAERLAVAAEDVEAAGGQVSHCYLVTNRPLGPGARKLLLPKARLTGIAKTSTRDILKKMDAVDQMPILKWRQSLEEFAARYGAFLPEIEVGIGQIVGQMFQQGANPLSKPSLSLADLVKAFTGTGDARPLVRSEMGSRMKRELQRLSPEGGGRLVRREILDRVGRDAPDRALIVFAGRGGMGKTASLYAWAEELSKTDTGPVQPLVAATNARVLPDEWSDTLLSKWRNLHVTGREQVGFDRLVARLKIANPRLQPPILHVCLDGLDEHANDSSHKKTVGKVVDWFLEQDRDCRAGKSMPMARLVVTCRDQAQFSKDWLPNASGFRGDRADLPPMFEFEAFSESEFVAVVRANLPSALQGRLLTRGTIAPARQTVADLLDDGPVGKFGPAVRPASEEVIAVLHDPAMWRSFLELDDQAREAAMNNDRQALQQLGTLFMNRFCDKLEKRTSLKKKEVLLTLHSIATAYRGRAGEFLTAKDWMQAASDPAFLDALQTRELRSEAISGGLINDNAVLEWQWRNSIIEGCLLSSQDPP